MGSYRGEILTYENYPNISRAVSMLGWFVTIKVDIKFQIKYVGIKQFNWLKYTLNQFKIIKKKK